jgi:hypothetical protein
LLGIRDYSLDSQSFNGVDIFNLLDKVLIANLLRVAASGISFAEQIS